LSVFHYGPESFLTACSNCHSRHSPEIPSTSSQTECIVFHYGPESFLTACSNCHSRHSPEIPSTSSQTECIFVQTYIWIKVFFPPTDAQLSCLKTILKFTLKLTLSRVLNSAADIHQQGPGNICIHTTRLITPMVFN
jgi:hypothetical protein